MSRKHARIHFDGRSRSTVLDDLDSKNGVFVSGARVRSEPLEAGSVIRLGDTIFVLDVGSPSPSTSSDVRAFVGTSFAAQRIRGQLARVARSGATVLLSGPTGSGKEVAAACVHAASGRQGRFVPVNCAAIPATLLEATLFGSEKGAFTGADTDRRGVFVEADGGTLFLDEVAELAPAAQAALLRVLEDRVVTPIGATRGRRIDVRIVAASNTDLSEAVEAGRFRADLLARLEEWPLTLPPLVERPSDIIPLMERFHGGPIDLSADAAEALTLASWPTNARGIRALILRLQVTQDHPRRLVVGLDDIPGELVRQWRSLRNQASRPERPDRATLEATLSELDGNVSAVAARFGRTRKQIYRWIKQDGIDLDAVR